MSHQRASSTSSISNAFDSTQRKGGMAAPVTSSTPSTNFATSTSAATASTPLSISIPRQRSFSSSFSLAATSPRTFTGSSIIANPSHGFLSSSVGSTTPFSAAFGGPLASPTSATSPTGPSSAVSTSQTVPVLHRRFSSSFNQLNQIVGSTPSTNGGGGSQATDRGRRASFFGGGQSPPSSIGDISKASPPTSSSTGAGGLFRKFSSTARQSTSHYPHDKNDTGPTTLGGPQPNHNINPHGEHNKFTRVPDHTTTAATSAEAGAGSPGSHLSAVDRLKPLHQDKHSRSSSPMRSMILNGQMLD